MGMLRIIMDCYRYEHVIGFLIIFKLSVFSNISHLVKLEKHCPGSKDMCMVIIIVMVDFRKVRVN